MTPHDTASAAMVYIERNWAVIPLHDVLGGSCSCGSADPGHAWKQGGKHPLDGGWQNRGLRTPAAVRDAWARRPGANLGIVTGRASGIWVLDVDPDNGGDKQLAGLVAAFGPLPETYAVRTGSGGTHYYWIMPDFDFTNSRGRLPLGLDVRGNASQVVAPPSHTLKGPYAVALDVVPVAAPGWLLEMIRPLERVEPAGAGEWSGWEPGMVEAAVNERGPAYARSAVRELLGQLSAAQPGERNTVAYRVGRRLAELVAAGWAKLDSEHVWAGYMAAAAACDVDGGFTQSEAYEVLVKAVRAQASSGRTAELPPADHLGTVTGWTPPTDFDGAGQDPAVGSGVFVSPGSYAAGIAQSINGPSEQGVVAPAVDTWESAVLHELGRLMVRDEAARRMRQRVSARSPIVIMDREAQLTLPETAPLIARWLGAGQVGRIYGPPGAGKSFAAVEMSACVSTGRPWHGAPVAQGEVIYFAVEDAAGVALRLRAWEKYHGVEHHVHLVSTPIQMNVETVARILDAVRTYFAERHIALIVLDTQAMVTVGMDENSAADMGMFVEAVKLLAAQTGAAVLTVHHSGLKGGRARGSTAILGAMDVEIEAANAGGSVTLTSTKQKNVAKPPPLMVSMRVVDMDQRDTFGDAVTSCVLVAEGEHDVDGSPFTSPSRPVLSALQRRALAIAAVLTETNATGEAYSRVRTRAAEMTDFGKSASSVTSSFSKAWAYLVERGRVAKAQGREAYYFIDIDGLDRLAANPAKVVSGGPEVYSAEG